MGKRWPLQRTVHAHAHAHASLAIEGDQPPEQIRSLTSRLSNPTQNDLPPPYSVAVHTQPPLKKDEEVVYNVRPGLSPATYPHYIPQYPPHVVVTQTAPSSTGEGFRNVSTAYLYRRNTVWMRVKQR